MSKSNSIIRVSENFTIRKIVPRDIVAKYFKGDYTNRELPQQKIKTSNALLKIGKDVGRNTKSEVFRFTDRSNNNQTIYTTNHSLYKYALDSMEDKGELPILKCKYCKRLITKTPIGLPVSMFFLEKDGVQEIAFLVIDSFCDFGCVFSHLKRITSNNRIYQGPLYMNAEQMLYCMFYKMHPDKVGTQIPEKPDWDLLRENGGPLTNEEFDCDTFEYASVPSVSTFPVKRQYFKNNREK